ncbi:MAG TPA: amidohydrolase family protein [Armatimonadota bacterium]|nr:amidohydrolase family protein [Armatimonadota bacterium]
MSEAAIRDINTVFGFWTSRPVDVSLETLCGILDKHKVTRAATLSTVGVFVDSRRGNDRTWQAAQEHPQLLPVATFDPRGGIGCLGEMAERAEQGFRIFALFPETQGWSLDHACCAEVLRLAGETGIPVMAEAASPGAPTRIGRLAEQYGVRVILSQVSLRNLGETMMVMKSTPNVFVETHILASSDGIELVVDEIGSDRLLFGSGAPLQYFSSAYLRLRFADLTASDKAAVLGANFARLLEQT